MPVLPPDERPKHDPADLPVKLFIEKADEYGIEMRFTYTVELFGNILGRVEARVPLFLRNADLEAYAAASAQQAAVEFLAQKCGVTLCRPPLKRKHPTLP